MNVLLAYSATVDFDEDTHPNLRPSGTYNDGTQDWWLYLCTEILTADRVIGAWESDGSVLVTDTDPDTGEPTAYYPIHPDYQTYIRPLGNATVTEFDQDGNPISTTEGVATDSLDYHHWFGGDQRNLQEVPVADTLAEFPETEQPIALTMERWFDETPGWEGNAWRATIEFSDPTRAPNSRAVGIYSDTWGYLYTTGAFVWTDTGELDAEGNPVFKWQTQTPVGRATADPEPFYYALLFGSLQEGRMVLEPNVESKSNFYWENNQTGPALQAGAALVYYNGVVVSHTNGDGTGPFGVTHGT